MSRKILIAVAIGSLIAIMASWLVVNNAALGRTYSDIGVIPRRHVGLVLGCSRLLPDGRRNGFFDSRIQAAAQLIRAGKIDYLVVSERQSRARL